MRNGLFSEGRNPNLLMVAVFAGIFFVDFIIYMLLNAFECDYKVPNISISTRCTTFPTTPRSSRCLTS